MVTQRPLALSRLASSLARYGYGVAAWALMGFLGPPCWLLVMVLPRLSWRWQVTRAALRLLVGALRTPVEVQGELPPAGQPCVVVANHSSILDSFVLFLAFREPVVFVAGGVFSGQKVTGPFLRRVGAQFVSAPGTGRQAVRSVLAGLAELARSGHRVVFFPEGGLNPEPVLRRFQLGAFLVAAQAASPVVPVAISGTAEILAPGARLPRRHPVSVAVAPPMSPPADGWAAAHQAADVARDAVENLLARLDRPGGARAQER